MASKKGVPDEAELASALRAPLHGIFFLAVFQRERKRKFIKRLPFERALVVIIITVPIEFLGTMLWLVVCGKRILKRKNLIKRKTLELRRNNRSNL